MSKYVYEYFMSCRVCLIMFNDLLMVIKIDAECLNLQEFHDLCEKVAITTEEDMLKAFKKIDFDNDGLIDHDELIRILMEVNSWLSDKISCSSINGASDADDIMCWLVIVLVMGLIMNTDWRQDDSEGS